MEKTGWESLFELESHEAKPAAGKPVSYDEDFVVDKEVIKALEEIEYLEASQEHIVNAKTTGNTNQTKTCLRLTQIASSH